MNADIRDKRLDDVVEEVAWILIQSGIFRQNVTTLRSNLKVTLEAQNRASRLLGQMKSIHPPGGRYGKFLPAESGWDAQVEYIRQTAVLRALKWLLAGR